MQTQTNEPEFNLTPLPAIRGWEEYLHDGEGYLKTAVAGYGKRQNVFTAEILYNIIGMAIEKFVMAALMRHGTLPYNHTITDLVQAMDETFPHAMDQIRAPLLTMDAYQQICDVDAWSITPPPMDEIPGMLELAEKVRRLVTDELLTDRPPAVS